jgi:hypothetical protein
VDDRAAIGLVGWFFVSVAVLAALMLFLRPRITLGTRLIGLGVVLAVAALWYGMLAGLPTRTGVPVQLGYPGLSEGLLKLAAVLVLGGIVVSLLGRDAAPAVPVPPEVPRHVPPSV